MPVLGTWLVTGYDLAVEVLRDARTFTVDDPRFSTAKVVGPSMLSLDGAEHARHRGPFNRVFRRHEVHARLAAFTWTEAGRLVSVIEPGGAAELRRAVAGPLAVAVMAEALGLGRADPVQVLAWYDGIVAAVQAEAATAEARAPAVGTAGTAAFAELAGSLREVIAAPGSASLLSEAAGPLTETEVISNAAVMMFGGIETTEGMIANALLHLLSSPVQLELVLADRGLVPAAIEESLRLEPAAAVVDRYATTDARLGDAGVRTGDQVTVSIAGANRDPAVFSEPHVFDVRRPNAGRHLAFAHGPHFCLGAHLARLEAQVAIGILLSRLPRLRLDPRYPSAPRGLVFRKPPDLRVRWNQLTLGAQPCHRHAACGIAARRSLTGSALFSQANRTTPSPRRSAAPPAGPTNATWPRTSSSTPQSPRLIRQRQRAIRASRKTLMTVSSAPVRINLNRLRRSSRAGSRRPNLSDVLARVLRMVRFRRRDRSLMAGPSDGWQRPSQSGRTSHRRLPPNDVQTLSPRGGAR